MPTANGDQTPQRTHALGLNWGGVVAGRRADRGFARRFNAYSTELRLTAVLAAWAVCRITG
jgi:hypothetical protein